MEELDWGPQEVGEEAVGEPPSLTEESVCSRMPEVLKAYDATLRNVRREKLSKCLLVRTDNDVCGVSNSSSLAPAAAAASPDPCARQFIAWGHKVLGETSAGDRRQKVAAQQGGRGVEGRGFTRDRKSEGVAGGGSKGREARGGDERNGSEELGVQYSRNFSSVAITWKSLSLLAASTSASLASSLFPPRSLAARPSLCQCPQNEEAPAAADLKDRIKTCRISSALPQNPHGTRSVKGDDKHIANGL
ncbi:hypothetical protein O3P69_006330 [Scylla paramamosain]|uniref:Uncharacterized protein n=1 Tax=Scylla paramamosain TaxID=85552 RepID=A0AAW0U5J9_SCYPA